MKANINYKSVLDGIKNLKKKNEAFHALDDQSKRMEIAWDVLKLLEGEIIFPSCGCYWDDELHLIQQEEATTSEELCKLFNTSSKIKGCSVCARGAMMLSQIRLGNNLLNEYAIYEGDDEILEGFSMDSFYYMEREYEKSEYDHPYRTNTKQKLMNICCNVLVNGDFNKNDRTNYLIS